MTTKVRLVDELIGWYLWKARIADCHKLIKRHIYVDNIVAVNRILGRHWVTYTFRTQEKIGTYYSKCTAKTLVRQSYVPWSEKKVTYSIASPLSNHFKKLCRYQDDPKSARDYIPSEYREDE